MSLPSALSPSPVHEAFTGIQWDPLEKLELSDPEKALFRAAEDNPIDYTLADQHDAEAYAHLLLKVVGLTSFPPGSSSLKVSKLSLDQCLPDDEALQLLYVDCMGVVLHYAITKLSEVVICLKSGSRKAQVTLATTFYPSGILTEHWRPLLRILSGSKPDPFAQRGAAFCLACILQEGCSLHEQYKLFSPVTSIVESFVSWITSRLKSATSPSSLSIVTPSLICIILRSEARKAFDEAGGVGYLARHLRVQQGSSEKTHRITTSAQQVYELTYCLWLMSFDCCDNERMCKHFHRDGAIAALVDLVAAAPREKVVRLALSTLRNLAVCTNGKAASSNMFDGHAFLTEMIACGLLKSVDRMREREWSDPDIADDLQLLSRLLHDTFRHMTRWDVYQSEIESSHLQWVTGVHTEKFFRENVRRMEGSDGNFRIVKVSGYLSSVRVFLHLCHA
jgi:V-type H+-transporting ATPase subunit H